MNGRICSVALVLTLGFGGLGALVACGSNPGGTPSPRAAPAPSPSRGSPAGSSPHASTEPSPHAKPSRATPAPRVAPSTHGGSTPQPTTPSASTGVGDTINLAGMDKGEQIAATVVRVVDPAQPASDFDQPEAGQRLVGVRLKLVNTGSNRYSDSPDNGAVLVDTSGQSFNADLTSISAGPSFPGSVDISPGDTRLGYISFAVPKSSKIDKFQFTLDSGFADQTGEWSVAGAAEPQLADSAAVVEAYFAAINSGDYKTAWDLGGKNFTKSYDDFVAGFAETAHDTVTIVSTSGNAVRVTLDAEQTDGSHRRFAGTYYVNDGEITGANIRPI